MGQSTMQYLKVAGGDGRWFVAAKPADLDAFLVFSLRAHDLRPISRGGVRRGDFLRGLAYSNGQVAVLREFGYRRGLLSGKKVISLLRAHDIRGEGLFGRIRQSFVEPQHGSVGHPRYDPVLGECGLAGLGSHWFVVGSAVDQPDIQESVERTGVWVFDKSARFTRYLSLRTAPFKGTGQCFGDLLPVHISGGDSLAVVRYDPDLEGYVMTQLDQFSDATRSTHIRLPTGMHILSTAQAGGNTYLLCTERKPLDPAPQGTNTVLRVIVEGETEAALAVNGEFTEMATCGELFLLATGGNAKGHTIALYDFEGTNLMTVDFDSLIKQVAEA